MKHEEFSQLSEDWWNPNGPLATLHSLNPLRINYIEQTSNVKSLDILDIGCGGGILSEGLSKLGANITGVDASQDLINVARNHAESAKLPIKYLHSTANDFFENFNEKYDMIIAFEVLEHIESLDGLINQMSKCIKPGGQLILSTINRNITSYFKAILAAEYILNMVPKGTHRYDWFLKPSELINECQQSNLKLIHKSGLDYNPLTNSFSLTQDMSTNFFLTFKYEIH